MRFEMGIFMAAVGSNQFPFRANAYAARRFRMPDCETFRDGSERADPHDIGEAARDHLPATFGRALPITGSTRFHANEIEVRYCASEIGYE